jgi:hypothetical protein
MNQIGRAARPRQPGQSGESTPPKILHHYRSRVLQSFFSVAGGLGMKQVHAVERGILGLREAVSALCELIKPFRPSVRVELALQAAQSGRS